jgi:hypothetical protein
MSRKRRPTRRPPVTSPSHPPAASSRSGSDRTSWRATSEGADEDPRADPCAAEDPLSSAPPIMPSGTLLAADRFSNSRGRDGRRVLIATGDGLIATDLNGANRQSCTPDAPSARLPSTNQPPGLRVAAYPGQIAVVDTVAFAQVHLWETYENAQMDRLAYAGARSGGTTTYTHRQSGRGAGDRCGDRSATPRSSCRGLTASRRLACARTDRHRVLHGAHRDFVCAALVHRRRHHADRRPGSAGRGGTQFTADDTHVLCSGTLRQGDRPVRGRDVHQPRRGRGPRASVRWPTARSSCQDANPIISVVRQGSTQANRTYHLDNRSRVRWRTARTDRPSSRSPARTAARSARSTELCASSTTRA